ncbi:hypothetical protein NE237_017061 [Protea cynaroides]|uniref:Cytochrome P450 n=1 Tax=Protea cynaroides TaxID=273540 RepID=A0A9Q0K7B3_9MAGN|nr:hypothetical protein NE237_017061 [Protea cynaroides]
MGLIIMLLSSFTTYNSAKPLTSILIVFFTSVVAFFFILIIFGHKNWRNTIPLGPRGWPIFGYLPYLSETLHVNYSFFPKPIDASLVSDSVAREILKYKEGSHSSRTITGAIRCVIYDGTTLVFVSWRLLVNDLLKSLYNSSRSKTLVNISESMFVAVTNLTSNLCCSKSLFGGNMEVKELMGKVFDDVFIPNLADFIPVLKIFDPQGVKKRLSKVAKKLDSGFDKLIDERLEEKKKGIKINKNGRLDLLDVFLDYKNERKDECLNQFSRVDIKGMLIVSMLL